MDKQTANANQLNLFTAEHHPNILNPPVFDQRKQTDLDEVPKSTTVNESSKLSTMLTFDTDKVHDRRQQGTTLIWKFFPALWRAIRAWTLTKLFPIL